MDKGYGRGWKGWLAIQIASIIFRGYCLQYTNFLSLSDKESVIVSTMISVRNPGKHGEIKAAPVVKTPSLPPPSITLVFVISESHSSFYFLHSSFLAATNMKILKTFVLREVPHYSSFNSWHVHCCCHVTTMKSDQNLIPEFPMYLNEGLFQ